MSNDDVAQRWTCFVRQIGLERRRHESKSPCLCGWTNHVLRLSSTVVKEQQRTEQNRTAKLRLLAASPGRPPPLEPAGVLG